MNNKKRISLIVICGVLIVAVVASMGLLLFKSCESKQAHADYISDIANGSNVFVNFNQLVPNSYINYTNSSTGWLNFNSSLNVHSGDKLYCSINATNTRNPIVLGISGTNNSQTVIEASDIIVNTKISKLVISNGNYNFLNTFFEIANTTISQFNFINLTQMFGIGNEPDLNQCQKLFVAPYYNFNTGTELSYLGLDAYSQGYNDAVGSFEYKVANSNFVNSVQSVSMNGYKGTASVYNINYLRINHVNDTDLTTCYVPFNFTVNATTHVSFGGRFSHNDGNNSLTFKVAYMDMGSNTLKEITTFKASGGNTSTPVNFQFDAPQDLSGIYIIFMDEGFDFFIYNCVLSILTTNATGAIQTAHDQGYEQAKYYYESQYAVGGELYNEIYQKGVLDAESGNKVFQDAWQFMGTAFSGLGDLMTVEFFPGLPIGIFVALPLLLGLIYFIVRLVKGGS